MAQGRAFVVAADHANLSRAADELYLTQQAVSKRLARLEASVGALFDRGPTGLELTARGRRFLPVARELLASAALRSPPCATTYRNRCGSMSGGTCIRSTRWCRPSPRITPRRWSR